MPLVIVMMALTLLTGLGTVLVVGTMTETAVAAGYRQGMETFYAADAAVEFAIRDLAARSDWDGVLTGDATSAFVDGPPGGTRQVGAAVVDLARATAEVDAILAARVAPSRAPAQLYAYGHFEALAAAASRSPAYLGVWVAEPAPDEDAPAIRLLYVVGRAYGPTGGVRTILVTVARPVGPDDAPTFEVRAWEEPQ